jgi:hypothetical protein
VVLEPAFTVWVDGEAEIENPPVPAAVTTSVTVVVCVVDPAVPVTVIGYDPVAVVEATVKFKVELPEPGAGMGLVPNAAVTPVGMPDADKVIAELKPFRAAVVIVDVPLLPWTTETEVGEAEMEKSGVPVTTNFTVVECVRLLFTLSVPVIVNV